MAIWAEIKKAINSDFSKPLNELIDDCKRALGLLVNGYVVGDDILRDFGSDSTSYNVATSSGNSYYYDITALSDPFIPEFDGFVQVDASVTFTKVSGEYPVERAVLVVSDSEAKFVNGIGTTYDLGVNYDYDSMNKFNFLSAVTIIEEKNMSSVTKNISGVLRVQRNIPVYLLASATIYGSGGVVKAVRNSFTIKGKFEGVI